MLQLRSRCRCLVVAGLLSAATAGEAAHAQREVSAGVAGSGERQARVGRSGEHLAVLGANVLVSSLTAAVLSWHRGGSFFKALSQGAAGGAVVYAGKALVVKDGPAAPLLGRQLAAAGASVVRNAGAGEPALGDLSLPFGPLHLHVAPGRARAAWLSLDLMGVATLAGALLAYDARVDWEASLATGAPVLVVADPADALSWNGRHVGGNLLLRDQQGSARLYETGATLAHERVHLLEYDQMALLWSEPLERALLGQWRWTRRIQPHVDLSFSAGIAAGLRLLPEHVNPVEIEARFLAETR